MLFFPDVELNAILDRSDPLYVGHFYPSLYRISWKARKKRQNLIFSVAFTWYNLTKKFRSNPGMLEAEMFLTSISSRAGNYKPIFDKFFTIRQLGFNTGVKKSATFVSPKRISQEMILAIEKYLHITLEKEFNPGDPPTDDLVKSTVQVVGCKEKIIDRLKEELRDSLIPQVKWLYSQEGQITFYSKPSGQLQARDTSVWPIKAIELWPGWLRSELFGMSIDLENAYSQFLISHLENKHLDNYRMFQLKYPDLIELNYNKTVYRENICKELKLPVTKDNIDMIKKLLMAVANGSNASGQLMITMGSQSQACDIVKKANPNLNETELFEIGNKLRRIARQFRSAKREVCFAEIGLPTRENVKRIHGLYFQWERTARYKIWKEIGQSGLMLHDGLDGVISDMSNAEIVAHIAEKTALRVSAKN